MSEDRAELFKALCAFQQSANAVPKGEKADTGKYRYTYADLAGVIDHIREPLALHGLSYFQAFDLEQGDIVLITTIAHISGASICSTIPIRGEEMLNPQKMGGLITYYRRYALLAMLGLATEDDDGKSNSQPRQAAPTRNAPQPRSQPQPAAQPGQQGMSLDDEIIAGFYTSIAHATSEKEIDKIGAEIRDARLTDAQKEPLRAEWRTKKTAYAATT